MKHEPEQKQGGEAVAQSLPNECHATANVSLLARQQKLPTAALSLSRLTKSLDKCS